MKTRAVACSAPAKPRPDLPGLTEKETGRLITELNRKDELYYHCLLKTGAGPVDGCCYATARALQLTIGGDLWTMWGKSYGSDLHQGQHVLVRTGDLFWDGEGRHTEADLKKRWAQEEHLSDIEFKPFQDTDVPESPRDPDFVATLEHFFKTSTIIDPEETAKLRSLANILDRRPIKEMPPADAIAHLLNTEDWQDLSPVQINKGNCDLFADALLPLTGGELWETDLDGGLPTHQFIKWKDRYYDAQTPLGVQHWKHLPIFQSEIDIHQERIDAHGGQTDFKLWTACQGNMLAFLEFSEFDGVPKVTNIYVPREAQRHGVATQLVMQLQELYPDQAIERDYCLSTAGQAFYDALPKIEVPIEEVRSGQHQMEVVTGNEPTRAILIEVPAILDPGPQDPGIALFPS